ncbi:MAG: hypothetical protein RLZZ67_254 [Candidatus Parcubacteria bacterium]|jgi:hypothetical protein
MDSAMKKRLLIDLCIIAVSIFAAGLFTHSNIIDEIVVANKNFYALNSFIAGLFFTSVFTTAPAMVALGKLGSTFPPLAVALAGGLGALIGDLIIFSFIKGHISEDISFLISRAKSRRIKHLFHYRFMRWSLAFVGAIIIASPLPDELGLTLMGLSRMSTAKFIVISFTFNALGILAISLIARSL